MSLLAIPFCFPCLLQPEYRVIGPEGVWNLGRGLPDGVDLIAVSDFELANEQS